MQTSEQLIKSDGTYLIYRLLIIEIAEKRAKKYI